MTDIATNTDHLLTAFALAAGEGETFWWESQLFTIKCSEGGLGLVDCTLESGSEPPMHIHTRETEFIYVIDGELTVYVGDETLSVQTERVFSDHRTADYVPGVPGPQAARHDLQVLGQAFEDAGLIITGPHPRDL